MLTTSKNSKPEISCIYVNYQSAAFLKASLQSLFAFEKNIPFEVIVVNNDAREQEQLENLRAQYPFQLQAFPENPGFGTACNQGARLASGNILFFINPDTKWQQSFFQGIRGVFKETPLLGALGVQLTTPMGKPEAATTSKTRSFLGSIFAQEAKEWVSGGALFVPKNIFERMGGFDERFFLYFEDMDLCLRMQEQGQKIALYTEAALIHFGGGSQKNKKRQKYFYDQSLYKYAQKHWNLFQYFIFRILHPVYRFFFPYGRS